MCVAVCVLGFMLWILLWGMYFSNVFYATCVVFVFVIAFLVSQFLLY